ncbi:LysM peptidoglycan-binding domain-containing protein [Actinomycetospora atypica]|uniref:LysM peptidoglycan-binding domain-containing protein n=1 Tax=Actinomycetospora atypica TaxID=1290095 RepID=A0ABV9YSP2_9PSEU
MNVGRVVGVLVLILVLYAIITQPLNSAAMARSGGSSLAEAGTSVRQFLTSLDFNGSSGGSSASRTAGTRDGSTASSYTVRPGDTLSTIAARQGTTAAALAARNDLADADLIVPGQELDLG